MNAEEFALVAATCSKWSERSLGVARALLVEGVSLSIAAAAHEMSRQQANVVRSRFLAKAEKRRIDEFMARQQPKLAFTVLEPFEQAMQTLRGKGYTIRQVVAFLREQGIETSVTTVSQFLKE